MSPTKRELQDEWLQELESGNWKQGQSALRSKNGRYCCLGVACEIAARYGLIPPAAFEDGHYRYSNCPTYLPEAVRKLFGFFSEDGGSYRDDHPCCVDLNDDYHYSFPEIAAHIRAHRNDYFTE